MIEDLADPLIHLIRNAVDHGVEAPPERKAVGKPEKSLVRLEARQEGDHIVLIIADDGKGMSAERIRAKAVEQGLITEEEANTLDERQSLTEPCHITSNTRVSLSLPFTETCASSRTEPRSGADRA